MDALYQEIFAAIVSIMLILFSSLCIESKSTSSSRFSIVAIVSSVREVRVGIWDIITIALRRVLFGASISNSPCSGIILS